MKLANCMLALVSCAGMWAQTPPDPKPDVAGMTLDERGVALRKVDLMLLPLAKNAVGDPMPSYNVISASDGTFEFYGIPAGRYRLLADRAGYLRSRYGAKTPWGAGTVLTLRANAPVTGLRVRMQEQCLISGKVVYDGLPNSMAIMLLQEKYLDGKLQISSVDGSMLDPSGEFRFNKLPSGRYYLLAGPTSGADPAIEEEMPVATFYPGKSDQSAAQPIALQAGQTLSLEFAVLKAPYFRVGGTVLGLPPNPARVSLILRTASNISLSGSAYPTVVGPDGSFQFPAVPAGAYVLTASVPGASPPLVGEQQINVQGELSALSFKLEQYPMLRGTVKSEGATAPLPRTRIILTPVAKPPFQTVSGQTLADGSFAVGPVLPGRYRYQFEVPPGAYLKSAKLGDKDALPIVDLNQPAPDARLEIVFSNSGARIEGAMVDAEGKPADGTAVLVPDPPQPDQPWLYKTVEAGEFGKFEFQAIRPGKYRLYAWEELQTGAHLDPEFTAKHPSIAVEVGENERKQVSVKRIDAK